MTNIEKDMNYHMNMAFIQAGMLEDGNPFRTAMYRAMDTYRSMLRALEGDLTYTWNGQSFDESWRKEDK